MLIHTAVTTFSFCLAVLFKDTYFSSLTRFFECKLFKMSEDGHFTGHVPTGWPKKYNPLLDCSCVIKTLKK